MSTARSKALFVAGDRRTTVACWAAVAGTAGQGLALGGWIAAHAELVRGSPLAFLAAIAGGLFVADVASGAVHWSMDTWFDERSPFQRAVLIAREHHSHPSHILQYRHRDHIGFGALPGVVATAPVAAGLVLLAPASAAALFAVTATLVVLVAMFFGGHLHTLGHRHARTRVGRALQHSHLIMSPQVHRRHHAGTRATHYCVINGWANPVCDAVGFWRGLEWAVSQVTGAVPRDGDARWMAEMGPRSRAAS